MTADEVATEVAFEIEGQDSGRPGCGGGTGAGSTRWGSGGGWKECGRGGAVVAGVPAGTRLKWPVGSFGGLVGGGILLWVDLTVWWSLKCFERGQTWPGKRPEALASHRRDTHGVRWGPPSSRGWRLFRWVTDCSSATILTLALAQCEAPARSMVVGVGEERSAGG